MNKPEQLIKAFSSLSEKDPRFFLSPGRINLMGDHTDYNKGWVLPAAINRNVYMAIELNHSERCQVMALDKNSQYDFSLDYLHRNEAADWPNYFIGMVAMMREAGVDVRGFDCAFTSNIPIGAGLSSSAALCACLAFALNEIFEGMLSRRRLVEVSQLVEHRFIGVNCGNMDQTASLFGKEGHVLQFDCRSLDITYASLNTGGYEFVVCDSGVKHSHASSGYNDRKAACDEVVEYFQKRRPEVFSLRDLSSRELDQEKEGLGAFLYKRANYVLKENERVLKGSALLDQGDVKGFGKLMYLSHQGMSKEYEISCPELDYLVEITEPLDFVLGARMMGGGFGGCSINLVHKAHLSRFHSVVSEAYRKEFGWSPKILDLETADGTRESQVMNNVI